MLRDRVFGAVARVVSRQTPRHVTHVWCQRYYLEVVESPVSFLKYGILPAAAAAGLSSSSSSVIVLFPHHVSRCSDALCGWLLYHLMRVLFMSPGASEHPRPDQQEHRQSQPAANAECGVFQDGGQGRPAQTGESLFHFHRCTVQQNPALRAVLPSRSQIFGDNPLTKK